MIMEYFQSGDLTQHLARTFYDINWSKKLGHLLNITYGLNMIHKKGIIHRDFHSGNILIDEFSKICDLGLNKSATKAEDDETYGIIPYLAPEILHGQHYTRDSDIYSLGMIMWEVMTGRRPFWDRVHDVELIIQICDGLRPPIDNMNAPEGYVQLIKECWNPNPNKRPTARVIHAIISSIRVTENIDKRKDLGNLIEDYKYNGFNDFSILEWSIQAFIRRFQDIIFEKHEGF
ncbi:18246_t:CDS:2, partial [Funneliformis geosporum]